MKQLFSKLGIEYSEATKRKKYIEIMKLTMKNPDFQTKFENHRVSDPRNSSLQQYIIEGPDIPETSLALESNPSRNEDISSSFMIHC
jgi:hypothetical protein